MLKKLRLKFICITMVIVTIMLCVIFGLILRSTHQNLFMDIPGGFTQSDSIPGKPPQKPHDTSRTQQFTLSHNPDGTLSASGSHFSSRFTQEELRDIWNLATKSGDRSGILKDYGLRYNLPRDKKPNTVEFIDISSQLAAMDVLRRNCSFIGIGVWLAMLLCSVWLANWAIRPVEQAWNQQRQFVADASHELKTPLTVIMTNADLLTGNDFSDTEKEEFSRSIRTAGQQMRHLVVDMLELARADNGSIRTHFTPVDMSAVVTDSMLPFEGLFFEKDLTISSRIQPGLTVQGSEDHLKQVVNILLDNAQKYSRSPGEIQLTLDSRGKSMVLRLETPGTPLSKEDQSNVFRRFYRVDKARSDSGSYGLGLSIAQQIITEHKGKIWADSTRNSNIFYIQLPLTQK